MDKLTVGWIKL